LSEVLNTSKAAYGVGGVTAAKGRRELMEDLS